MKHLIGLFFILTLNLSYTTAQEKIVVTNAEDLPKHSYQLQNKDAVSIIESKESILKLAAVIKKDLLTDLDKYDIKENATLRNYYSSLRIISIVEGDYEQALEYIQKERKYADKESKKQTIGLESEVLLSVINKNNQAKADVINEQITKTMEQKLDAIDFDIIREDVESSKGRTELLSKNLFLGMIQGQVQPALDNNQGEVPGDLVIGLINMYYANDYFLPYKDAFNTAYSSYLNKNADTKEKVNIWTEREVVINNKKEYSSVVIGVWDSGTDVPILPKNNQWVNPKEKFDGKDTDKNGYVDDVFGIAYNLVGIKDTFYLEPIAHKLEDKKTYQNHLKGIMDLQANLSSNEATEIKKYLANVNPEDVNEVIEKLGLYSNYSHGTHVAGIAAEGNEMAKIMSARITFDYKNIPSVPTEEDIANSVKSMGETVQYFKDNKVRVVNMSWGDSYESHVSTLEMNGVGKDDEERKKLAKKYFTTLYNGFKAALETAPEILFVCAAGNSNDDVDFSAYYPSSINLSNLITVGAVDIEGKKTSFTTEGKSVDIYANGYEVESYVPGGDRLAFSGTSMASPNVANLAGKILAVNPKLKPAEVIDIIVKTSTKSEEDDQVLLIFPKKAVELASK